MAEIVFSVTGEAGVTFRVAADDTSNALIADGGLTMLGTTKTSGGEQRSVGAVLITCEDNDVRIAYGAAAVQGAGVEVGHVLAAGSSKWIANAKNVRALRYINKTNGSNAVMQITPYYGAY